VVQLQVEVLQAGSLELLVHLTAESEHHGLHLSDLLLEAS